MAETPLRRLAQILTGYSTSVRRGSTVLIEGSGLRSVPLVRELHRRCLERGAKMVEVQLAVPELVRDFYDLASPAQLAHFPTHRLKFLRQVDVTLIVRADENQMELAGIPREKLLKRAAVLRPLADWRLNRTRWVATRIPGEAMAQDAGLSLEAMEELYFHTCLRDWRAFSRRMDTFVELLNAGDTFQISAPDTELTLRIDKGTVTKADGHRNMPDGEVFMAPLLTSAEGHIRFNCPSFFGGTRFDGITLRFKDGLVTEAHAEQGDADLQKILAIDEGARRLGEFAFGLNPAIGRPTGNILFDEKISGSIHLALGSAYNRASNTNRSAIHWDLVRLMRDAEITLDGRLLQSAGLFIPEALQTLNPTAEENTP